MLHREVAQRLPVRHRDVPAPDRRRRKAVPAAVHPARRRSSAPDPGADEVITAAAVVELIHLATLYHDDVMDSATMRRGAESANARWDNTVAILTGDFLFAHASRLVADLGPDAVRIIAGHLRRAGHRARCARPGGPAPGEDPVEHYLDVIAEKTGSLIATSGRYGGMFSGCPPEQVDVAAPVRRVDRHRVPDLRRHHRHRLAGRQSGKTPGTDLREGVRTLPMLYALPNTGRDADRLRGPARPPDHRRRPGHRGAAPAPRPARAWSAPARSSTSGPPRPVPSSTACPPAPPPTPSPP